jgi:2-polyprenyl-6-methoxyphenol hydroxylase-like FAD-dependent oxidoreductase
MSTYDPSKPRVLIAGAGPVGLAMACELSRRGITPRIVDVCPEPTRTSKALGIAARTLEVLTVMGIAERFIAVGRKVHATNAYAGGKRIVHVESDELESPYPYTLVLPQADTERLLAAYLGELGGRIERGVKLQTFEQDESGVTATLADVDGREEKVRAGWLVGCDGAHSTVRHTLGLPFEGLPYDELFVLGDFIMDWALPDDEAHSFLAPDGGLVAIPLPGHGRWRLVGDAPIEHPTLSDFTRLLQARGAPPAKLSEGGWIASFRVHRRIVPRYRVGRVFLAGDAAHIHSPIGGQGMNTGIQDAFNLAWKLSLVDAGEGRPVLLDSYEPERRPVAAATLQGTDLATRVVTLRNPVAREVRDRLAAFLSGLEVVQKRILAQASEIAVGYRSSPIVGESRQPLRSATVDKRVGEGPTVADWVAFGIAPRPGDRAPDVTIDDSKTLFPLLGRLGMTVLLFDGSAPTPEGYANLASIAQRAKARWGALVDSFIVVPRPDRPTELSGEERVLLDPRAALHRRYGAGSECLYVIRPDGYVGFRGLPATWEALEAYLGKLLV